MDIDTLEGLMKCPLMKGLTQQEVMNLMHQIRYRVMKYEKGDIFAHAGDKCLHADIVLDGELLASVVSPSG
ncbi:MAG: Crp/Fnr family transcriptional regulator, partial [Prevotella sp.]